MRLYKAFVTVGGLTLISRALGFIRDILIAFALGTGLVADAFFVAFRFPNLFRRLFGEGAFNAAFVPLFAKQLTEEDKSAANKFALEVASLLVTALLITTAIAEIAMPWLIYAIAPGFGKNIEKLDLAILLTRITFPYLACMSLVALLSGVLNALDRFAAAAAVTIVMNIILIAAMAIAIMIGAGESALSAIILSVGVTIAGLAQLLMLFFCVKNEDFSLRLERPKLTPPVKRFLALSVPGIIAGGITQINILIGTIIASLQESAVSYLYYADRLYQLPLGIVGIAIGVVLLPELAKQLRGGNMGEVQNTQNRSLEFSALLTLPAAVALFVVGEPIIKVLFERGAFDAIATTATANALAAFAIGLPSFVLIKVFSPAFFAREDTKTPMYFAGISVVVNILFSLALFPFYQHVGIAIATAIAGWVNAGLLFAALNRRGEFTIDHQLKQKLPRIIIASAAMGIVLYLVHLILAPYFPLENGIWIRLAALTTLVACGIAAYTLSALLTGAANLNSIKRAIRPKRSQ